MASRPAQGLNSTAVKPPGPAYKADPGPTIKSRGTISNPSGTGSWSIKTLVADAAPTVTRR